MSEWSPKADHVDLYNKYQKPSTDGFDEHDLGNSGFLINEDDFVDVV